jgi:hypothetical protein
VVKILFKNIESSQHAKEILLKRVSFVIETFLPLKDLRLTLNFEMKRSSYNFHMAKAKFFDGFNKLFSSESDGFGKCT